MTETMDTSRGARLPRSARRKQLLAAAQEVFVTHGYHAAAMDDIAIRAGVSKPVLYQHFPGKLDLYLALLDTHAEDVLERVRQALAETEDNRVRVHNVLTAYFDFVDGADRGDEGAFRLIFSSDLGNEPAVRERVDRVARITMQAVADTVAADTGLGRPQAELLSVALTGAAQITATWWLDADRPIPKAEAVRLLETLQWRGISFFPLQPGGSGPSAGGSGPSAGGSGPSAGGSGPSAGRSGPSAGG
jgi:AcrR family transcriptional regulator